MTRRLELTPTAPFNFEHSLSVLAKSQAHGVRRTIQEAMLRFALPSPNGPVAAKLRPLGSLDSPKLELSLHASQNLTEAETAYLAKQVRFHLSLDDDLRPFYEQAAADPAFAPVLKALFGYHQVKFPSVFACACWALVTQRTPNSFAFKTMAALSEHLGGQVEHGGAVYTTFPEPADFLTEDAPAAILAATNNTRKTERLLPIAEAFARADNGFLRTAPYAEVAKWLSAVHGLGAWSVDYIMLRGLGRFERSPWTDTWLIEAISRVYTGGLTISRGDARALAERYGWYQGLWVHYLKTYLW